MAITYHAGRRIQGLSTETIETATLDHDFTESGSTSHTGNGTGNSVQGWTTNDYTYSKIDGGNDRLDFRSKGDGTNDSITYDLGSALSDSAWLIRFELTFSTLSSTGLAPSVDRNESVFGVFSSDYSSGFTTAQDSLGFQLHIDRDGTDRFYVHNTDGGSLAGYTSGQRNDDFTTTTYYVQMKRTSSTDFEVKFYDSTYTTEISGDFSSSVTVPSTVTGLRYFGFKNSDNYNYTGDGAGYINNVKIYDGVTSISSKPTDVQVGSRFEETDTRKMYHYEEQVPDYDYPMTTDPRTNTFNSSLCTITHANSTLQMNQITNGGAGGSATYIDLGSNLSTKWVMRFKTKQTAYTSYAGNSQFQVGMSSVAPTSTAYQISSSLNWIGIRWYYGTQIWSGGSRVGVEPRINQNTGDNTHNNSTWNGSGNDQRLYGSPREVSDTTTPYYHEIIWNVDTFTYNLYDNENYTGTKLATATMSSSTNTQWVTGTPSSISGLRYFVFKEGGDSSMGVWVNQLDDVEIWDGVIVPTTGNAWEELGT